MIKKCEICGKEYEARCCTQRFCSKECRNIFDASPQAKQEQSERTKRWREKTFKSCVGEVRVCIGCGKEFTITNNRAVQQRFCTEKCRKHYQHNKGKVAAEKRAGKSHVDSIAREARKRGESYGEYQARQWMEANKLHI